MGARIGAVVVFLALLPTAALAGTLPLAGAFGNGAGCHLYATGSGLTDDYAVLTADTFSSAAIGCDFGSLLSSGPSDFTVEAVCSPGGRSTVRVADLGARGFTVSVDGHGGIFDGLIACPPANDGEHA